MTTAQRNRALARYARSPLAITRELVMRPGEPAADYAAIHHEIERRYLDLGITFTNVVAPRGIAKSTVVAGGCGLHHLFFEDLYRWLLLPPEVREKMGPPRNMRKHLVLISKVQKEAKKRLATIKNILGDKKTQQQSVRFRQLMGDYSENTAQKWTEEQVILKDGSIISAIGTGQSVRGLNEGGLRPTAIILDDPEDEENTKTVERMAFNKRWLLNAVRPALDKKRGRLFVIGTPLNMQSMVVSLHHAFAGQKAHLRAEQSETSVRADSVWFMQYPDVEAATGEMGESWFSVKPGEPIAIDEVSGERLEAMDDGTRWHVRPGLLWPGWITPESIREEREIYEAMDGVGIGGFYREICCQVVGDAEQVFGPEFFTRQRWSGRYEKGAPGREHEGTLTVTHLDGQKLEDALVLPACVSTGVDPAFSTSQRADRTAIANLATTYSEERGEEVWELPGRYARLHPSQLLGAIASNHTMYRPARGLLETTAAQVFVAHELWAQHRIRYISDKPRERKTGDGSRIARLEPPMNPESAGKGAQPIFRHLAGSPLKSELLSYPRGKDDYADATEKAYRCRVCPRHGLESREAAPEASREVALDPLTL